jgi:hypothetical protein
LKFSQLNVTEIFTVLVILLEKLDGSKLIRIDADFDPLLGLVFVLGLDQQLL